jgi:hypothetical protein
MIFNGVKVFSATRAYDRNMLGDEITVWLAEHSTYELSEIIVAQSSDDDFHCLSITIFYTDPAAPTRQVPQRPTKG